MASKDKDKEKVWKQRRQGTHNNGQIKQNEANDYWILILNSQSSTWVPDNSLNELLHLSFEEDMIVNQVEKW